MNKDKIIDKFRTTIQDLLEALDAPFPDMCDCGGSSMCAICNAHRTLIELSSKPNDLTNIKNHCTCGCVAMPDGECPEFNEGECLLLCD